ncbi:MAG TPA: flagellar biosynthesis protein FlhF [Clostridia bacterium]|nr:flagellar biosynthesis protein FlhF [Clostridia bacterium]
MKIRRYLANNTQEAILKVKMDLGNEALILNTRKVRKKGLFGLFSKPMVEVLAAIDEYNVVKTEGETGRAPEKAPERLPEKSSAKPQEKPVPTPGTEDKINFDEKEEKIANLENKITNMEDLLQKLYVQMKGGEKPVQQPMKVETLQTGSKIADMFCSNLIKNEVEPDIARKITDTAASKLVAGMGVNDLAAQLQALISALLGKPETIKQGAPGKPTVVIFVGPTGVGKTTTLAKIAANYLLNQKKSIGLITADTYRIAAVEQLKTYAEILGIPVSVAYTAAEIRDAVGQHSDKDIVLIDTAGRSHRNKAQFEELKALIAASGADEVYLVLSATTSNRNCREILNSYDFLTNYKLIFTKTDEAPVQGIILNVRYLTGKSLSYITTGQSVPDDIETANIDKITKNLIGSIS